MPETALNPEWCENCPVIFRIPVAWQAEKPNRSSLRESEIQGLWILGLKVVFYGLAGLWKLGLTIICVSWTPIMLFRIYKTISWMSSAIPIIVQSHPFMCCVYWVEHIKGLLSAGLPVFYFNDCQGLTDGHSF